MMSLMHILLLNLIKVVAGTGKRESVVDGTIVKCRRGLKKGEEDDVGVATVGSCCLVVS